uniref:Uncharacterized protein n=1 Tax=Cacopsylla melanoneura TaxID=428564 RepID=A0A8D8Z3J9_9HEMI
MCLVTKISLIASVVFRLFSTIFFSNPDIFVKRGDNFSQTVMWGKNGLTCYEIECVLFDKLDSETSETKDKQMFRKSLSSPVCLGLSLSLGMIRKIGLKSIIFLLVTL